MFNPFTLTERYRIFRAHHKYSYPFLFMVIGTIKALGEIALVAGVLWITFPMAHDFFNPKPEASTSTYTSEVQSTENLLAISSAPEGVIEIEIPAVAPPDPTTAAPALKRIREATWMFKQDADKFTIQFGSSVDKEKLRMSALELSDDSVIILFPFKRNANDRTVYGFTSGIYDTVDQAALAIAGMPASIREFSPWIRPVDTLQKQIARTLANEG